MTRDGVTECQRLKNVQRAQLITNGDGRSFIALRVACISSYSFGERRHRGSMIGAVTTSRQVMINSSGNESDRDQGTDRLMKLECIAAATRLARKVLDFASAEIESIILV